MKWHDQRGGMFTGLLSLLFLVYFGFTIFLYFMHKDGLFRYEFGPEMTKEQEKVMDRNRVLELFRREKIVAETERKIKREKEILDSLKKQIELERDKLIEDRDYISTKMTEIEEKFKDLTDEEEDKLKELANLYSKMKANRAATILQELDDKTISQLLVRMQDKVSAKILSEIGLIDPSRAADISNVIQGKLEKEVFNNIR